MKSLQPAAPRGAATYTAVHPRTGFTWADQLRRHAEQLSMKEAFVDEHRTVSWLQLRERVQALAGAMQTVGVGRGDRVLLLMRNGIEYIEVLLAAGWLGAVSVPVNFRLTDRELLHYVKGMNARLAVVEHDLVSTLYMAANEAGSVLPTLVVGPDRKPGNQSTYEAAIAAAAPVVEPVACAGDELFLVMHTGGTTGRPKGAMLSHSNMAIQAVNLGRALRLVHNDDVVLIPSPLFHVSAIGSLSPCLMFGLRTVVAPSAHFDADDTLDLFEVEGITVTGMVPTQWMDICAKQRARPRKVRLRTISWGAAPATPALLRDMAATFPSAPNVAIFGQTETSPLTCVLEGQDALRKLGSVGRPAPTVDIRIVDDDMNDVPRGEVGEIVYRGPNVMLGYWMDGAATAQAFRGGWFHSGDLVKRDEEGFVWVVDRLKDMIISGGENIYCNEVEAVIADHPLVGEVAVVGAPHERWGETPVAYVVPASAEHPTEAAVIAHCRERLASYKKPSSVRIVAGLPRTPAGKVDKVRLRSLNGKEISDSSATPFGSDRRSSDGAG